MRVPSTPGQQPTQSPGAQEGPSPEALLMAAAQMGQEQQQFRKMEEFKTEQDKQREQIEDLTEMPRGMMSGDPRIREQWRKQHAPSKGYYQKQQGEPLTKEDDLTLDPTRGGTKMRWLKGT